MNNDKQHINEELLVKQLLGEATPQEQKTVEDWVAADDDHQKQYNDFKAIWDNSKQVAATSTVDTNAAWEKFKQRTEQANTKPTKTVSFPTGKRSMMRIAASVLLLIFCGIAGYFIYMQPITVASKNLVLTETLPDGTMVTLNKGSKISYPRNFKGETRDVKLSGEAFFDVTPDKSKPFIITVGEAKVRVVGTSFNIKCSKALTEVVVETGLVSVSKNSNEVMLNPNEKAIVTKNRKKPIKQNNTDQLYNYYRTKMFVCDETPLWRLVEVLNDAYKTDITIANSEIKDLPLNTTFNNESLDYVLGIISETFNIHIVEKEGRIVLK